jgi:hypothetical protein
LLDELMKTGFFGDERQDVYRLAIATALANKDRIQSPPDLVGASTSYNFAGGVDRDGRIRALIDILTPEEAVAPARYAERLAHAGLGFLHASLVEQQQLLQDVFPAPAP